ncbi:hypothetical protein D3C78_1138560 [compost metagenome]
MHHRNDGAQGELPFEANPDVDHDRRHGEQDANRGGEGEVTRNGRTDDFHAAEVIFVLKLAAHHGDRRLLGIFAAVLRLDADENVLRRTEVLRLDFTEVELVQAITDIGEIGLTLLGADFDDRAALEVDAEVQALGHEATDTGEHDDAGDHEHHATVAHERNVAAVEHGGADTLRQMFRTAAANPVAEHPRCQRIGREDGGDDTDGQRDREALDRAGAHVKQHARHDQRRQVGVDNGRKGAGEAVIQ